LIDVGPMNAVILTTRCFIDASPIGAVIFTTRCLTEAGSVNSDILLLRCLLCLIHALFFYPDCGRRSVTCETLPPLLLC
jgi:hypothetical protein